MSIKYKDKWDLSELYSGLDDRKISKDLKWTKEQSESFERKHIRKVSKYSGKQIVAMFKGIESMQIVLYKLAVFASLKTSLNTADQHASAFLQKVELHATQVANHFIFVELELAANKNLQKFAKDPMLKPYNIIFSNILKTKKFMLDAKQEKIMNMKSLTARSGWNEIFDKLLSNMVFELKIGKKTEYLNEEQILKYLHDSKRNVRKQAAAVFTKVLKENKLLLTHIYNMILADKMQNDQIRKHAYAEESRHLSNGVSKRSIDALVATTRRNFKLVQRFYKLKRTMLKLPKLYHYDRYAPIQFKNDKIEKYKFADAVKIVSTSFSGFDKEFSDRFANLLRRGHVDVYSKLGKSGGAFCAPLPEGDAYILLNYIGTKRDVQTLAHEMGHAVHDWFTAKLPLSVAHPPLALAETASVFAEMLVFDKLMKETNKREDKIKLLTEKIEDSFSTVTRQIVMFMFEQRAHNYLREHGGIRSEILDAIWLETQKEMYGDSMELGEGYANWWSYIPHFNHTPFYVYAYSFGGLLVFSLYEQFKKTGKDFIPKYKQFLALGGSKYPQEAVALFGFNLEKESFWQNGFDLLRELIDELEALVLK